MKRKLLALLALLASCSPKYESGVTKCSVDNTCPTDFNCINGVCISTHAPQTGGTGGTMGTGGMAAGGMTGTGGMKGTGGMMGTGGMAMGTGGMMMGTGGMMGGACTNPMFPVACPAHGGSEASCWETGVDCNTVQKCPATGKDVACKAGYTSNCSYPANPCGPVGNTCSDPTLPVFCPALGQAGPNCWEPNTDCSTVTVCGTDVFACGPNTMVDCATGKCVAKPPVGTCTDPTMPQACTPPAGVTLACYPTSAVCSTISTCAGQPVWCMMPDYNPDCGAQMCFPNAMCTTTSTMPCDQCAAKKCCQLFATCFNDPNNANCANTPTTAQQLVACAKQFCATECQGTLGP